VLGAVGGIGVFVGGGGTGVFVGGTGVAVGSSGSGVLVGGTGVAVGGSGCGVLVGGTGVEVGGSGVFVGGTGVSVGGTGVGVSVGSFGFRVGAGVWVGGSCGFVVGVGVAVGSFCGRGLQFGRATEPAQGSAGWSTTGPLLPGFGFGFGSGDGLTTAWPSDRLDADESAAKVAPTGFASPRTSTTAPAASHGISERRRAFLVLAFITFTRPVRANSGSGPRALGHTSSLRRPDISVMSDIRRERCSLANSSPKRAARRRPGACGGAG
jgi:hypothetical protein